MAQPVQMTSWLCQRQWSGIGCGTQAQGGRARELERRSLWPSCTGLTRWSRDVLDDEGSISVSLVRSAVVSGC